MEHTIPCFFCVVHRYSLSASQLILFLFTVTHVMWSGLMGVFFSQLLYFFVIFVFFVAFCHRSFPLLMLSIGKVRRKCHGSFLLVGYFESLIRQIYRIWLYDNTCNCFEVIHKKLNCFNDFTQFCREAGVAYLNFKPLLLEHFSLICIPVYRCYTVTCTLDCCTPWKFKSITGSSAIHRVQII